MHLSPTSKLGYLSFKHDGRNDMHIKLTVRWTFQTNNYRCICFITKIIIGLIVSQFMYSLGYSLIVCPYTLDSMNS